MNNFNPEKLSVKCMDGITITEPIIPRRYTHTHSDLTGDLFLTIGIHKSKNLRDSYYGVWVEENVKKHPF
ncbi:MAG: staygreen family protein [Bacillota bacterium]|nr:staygreen family protein [Bacillota bacterium]